MIRIYNLFPRLVGPAREWPAHIRRASALGFTHLYVNPIQAVGFSGSLYSIRDFLAVDPQVGSREELSAALALARELGLAPIADLVAGHAAVDSPLLAEHPRWFAREKGKFVHPGAWDAGQWIEWGDLVKFDHKGPEGRHVGAYLDKVGDWLFDLGFRGFRCDAAYQIPEGFWKKFLPRMRKKGALFFAENLGCKLEESKTLGQLGFDLLASSVMWWDFAAPWHRKEYEGTFPLAPLVAFPETHDTERAMARAEKEAGGHARLARRIFRRTLLFTSFYGSAWMMPVGCEYGFRTRLDCVNMTPAAWEEPVYDARRFVRGVNALAARHALAWRARVGERAREGVLLFEKRAGRERLILVLNPSNENRALPPDALPARFRDATPEARAPWHPLKRKDHLLEGAEARLLVA